MTYKYSFKDYNPETMARAVGTDLPISTKHSLEICNKIRRKNLIKVKTLLNDVMKKKIPIPYRRFTNGAGHRKGNMASGKYPIKASKNILAILESAETNAQQKGLNTSRLEITHIAAQKASRPMRYGRQRGREMKRTHIEVVLSEAEQKEDKRRARREQPKKKETEEKQETKKPASEKKESEAKTEKKEVKKEEKKAPAAKKEAKPDEKKENKEDKNNADKEPHGGKK